MNCWPPCTASRCSPPSGRPDPRTLTAFGFTAYSQTDEDGILQEIYRRIGATNRQFLEFGYGNGLENSSTYLLLARWSGF